MSNKQAEEKKTLGNQAFTKKEFDTAIKHYSEAIALDSSNAIYFSNRSICYFNIGEFERAYEDGARAISLDKSYLKAYFRCANALKALKRYRECENIVRDGLRVNSGDADLVKLLEEIKPLVEHQEKSKRKGMSPAELKKEEGNDKFRDGRFEAAEKLYSDAINLAGEDTALRMACLNNRAACRQQLGDHRGVVGDTSEVLDSDPNNLKALTRRMLGYEGLEKYKLALQDCDQILQLNPGFDVASRAKHRIQSVLRNM
eukprot:TRINITY_DN12590_c0_g1::TRINITY_DN12590_c0_g1_i1::g.2612::m.2612 TRINITY_DN12590_c0_g1::TRINITY_DN12590_c0_g1_i1::g.2612  ORF type:complete len:275 (-),score=63.08,sp/P31948/STIP1_HUMAN/29.05/4e-22,sp/P31948/STIP1_HUMAN/34.62/3e-15,sp/P31948/STIP1_HUMAN/36.63/1e-13,TPR_11/PF13414.1/1.3e-17,TPR_11/PF13414.1/58,TPR_11/PF13414.1/1.3e-10,TPR_11/PF13414.1/0.0027,TPR_1/PF00515.23/9e-05,TPR_1/PF00515.23/1.2,TPR_1/PF00515.23/3.8,TPR_1/PF00515.23/9.6,TPR_1/PF00515.23/1.5,TPR_1/PF00515.23/0.0024,TPR_2/PF07